MRGERGITLAEILVVVVFVIVAVALLTPAMARASRQAKVEACAANLKTLHAAQLSFYVRGGPAPELGKPYWERLAKSSPPLVGAATLLCPLADKEEAPSVQYLGPTADPRTLPAGDPIGCDSPGNHSPHGQEGGNILLNSGAVVNDNTLLEGLWGTAINKKCRP
jgi:type II secretory pathway pseudopilin PulG